MKNLALFDVDGTLIEYNRLDTRAYTEAVKRVLGIDRLEEDWSTYTHVTDKGIIWQLYQSLFSREPDDTLVDEVKRQYLRSMRERVQAGNGIHRPVAGAPEALDALRKSDEWQITFATGGWRDAACLKLKKAGLSPEGIPLFSADDSCIRTEIMKKAIETLSGRNGEDGFGRVVYIGDAVWDVTASRELSIPFLGVGKKIDRLIESGASHAVVDYSDLPRFLLALHECMVPRE